MRETVLLVGVLAWPAGVSRPRFLAGGEPVAVLGQTERTALVRAGDGRTYRIPTGFLEEKEIAK